MTFCATTCSVEAYC